MAVPANPWGYPSKVSVLGTDYRIVVHKYSPEFSGKGGFCDPDLRIIRILDLRTCPDWGSESAEKVHKRENLFLRHEITHAFLNESGLKDCANILDFSWAHNEEMVDWIANQGPKLHKAWKEANCL